MEGGRSSLGYWSSELDDGGCTEEVVKWRNHGPKKMELKGSIFLWPEMGQTKGRVPGTRRPRGLKEEREAV